MRSSSWCLVIASAIAIVSIGVATSSRTADAQQQPQPAVVRPPVNYSCEIPYDVVLPDPTDFNRQANFDIYSWNIFLALNWPASNSTSGPGPCNLQNGVARDCGKPLPSGDYGPTVWETYKPDWAVFRGDSHGGIEPAGWNCPLDPLPGCDSLDAHDAAEARMPVLRMIMKDANTAQEFLQAGTFAPLIDQNGSFVRYELRMNQDEFNFVNANKFWDSRNLKADVNFEPVGSNDDKTMGPIEVKAAWRILPAPSPRYHTRTVEIAWPNKEKAGNFFCKQYTMGLVGLHIAHKTKNAPQWIWSTFEQVDNYSGPTPSFNNPACPAAQCPPNLQPKAPKGGWSGDPRVKQTPPTQMVVGPDSVATVKATDINAQVQQKLAAMGSVWQYYQLVSTQWPSVPYIKGKPAEVLKKGTLVNQGAGQIPHDLANATMETYLMGPKVNDSSCMYCHTLATDASFTYSTDFSYLLQEAFPGSAGDKVSLKRRSELTHLFGRNTAVGGQPTKSVH